MASPQELHDAIVGAGFEHAPFAHPGEEGLASFWAQLRLVPPAEQAAIVVADIFAGANARAAFPGVLETIRAWRPQLIVRDSVEFGALVAAEVTGVPHVRVAVHQRVMEEQVCSLAAAPIDSLRQMAGLTADEGATLRAERIFTSFPELFEGPPASGTGRLVYRIAPLKQAAPSKDVAWQPANDELPLVYITFGTVLTTIAETQQLYRDAVAAVADLPVQVLLTTGRGFDLATLGSVPSNVRVEAWVPQAQVFPHTAMMVCHGGSGTVLGGLAAGIPQVVVPFGADQPANAHSVASLGAGLALDKPDTAVLRAAIERVLGDSRFRDAARLVSQQMSTLHSVEEAAEAMVALATH